MKTFVDPNKTILVDCDGVLLDWEYAFNKWMFNRGFERKGNLDAYERSEVYAMDDKEMRKLIAHFNSSAAIGFLPPLRDAIHYVKRLNQQHGWVFRMVTSLSTDKYAQRLRKQNIKNLFGDQTFEDFVFLSTGSDKDKALEPFKDSGCLWIEDKVENALVGQSLGLDPLLIAHKHNEGDHGITRAKNWSEVYDYVTGY